MINSLRLVNAQRHADTLFKFCKGLNTITGATDSGKSTVIRSLRWLLFNKPASTNILRRGTKKTEVIGVIDGHTIVRSRTKTKNAYVLDGVDKKGFGKSVPEEIASIIDMEDSLYLQRQSDPYFMVSIASASERAKMLERFANLSIISLSLSRARKAIHHFKLKFEVATEQLRSAKVEYKRLIDAIPSNDDIKAMFEISDTLTRKRTRLDVLISNSSLIARFKGRLAVLQRARDLRLDEIQGRIKQWKEGRVKYLRLLDLKTKVGSWQKTTRLLRTSIKELVELDWKMRPISNELEETRKRLNALSLLQIDIEKLHWTLTESKIQLEVEEEQLRKFCKRICPTCKRPLVEGHKHESQSSKEQHTSSRSDSRCPPNESETDLPF